MIEHTHHGCIGASSNGDAGLAHGGGLRDGLGPLAGEEPGHLVGGKPARRQQLLLLRRRRLLLLTVAVVVGLRRAAPPLPSTMDGVVVVVVVEMRQRHHRRHRCVGVARRRRADIAAAAADDDDGVRRLDVGLQRCGAEADELPRDQLLLLLLLAPLLLLLLRIKQLPIIQIVDELHYMSDLEHCCHERS